MIEKSDIGKSAPQGLGGWLVLVGFGLLFSPLRLISHLLSTYPPLFTDGAWDALTSPSSGAYVPFWAPLLGFEILGNVLLFIAGLVLIALFFQRSPRFPPTYIGISIASFLFILGDAWLVSLVLPDEPMFDPETTRELARSFVNLVVWVPYLLISKRVRNTFSQTVVG